MSCDPDYALVWVVGININCVMVQRIHLVAVVVLSVGNVGFAHG